MTRFRRHLRVLKLPLLGAMLLGVAGCNTSGMYQNTVGPASRNPGVAAVGAIGGGGIAGLATAAVSNNPYVILGAAGAGALAGALAAPALVEATSTPQWGSGTPAYGAGGYGYGQPAGYAPQPQGYVPNPAYGVPAASSNLVRDNPSRAGQACQPTPRYQARAVTTSGMPWVSCQRLLAAGEQAVPIPFR